jgi:hypothetical protein
VKRGTEYTVLGTATLQTNAPVQTRLVDMSPMIVYVSESDGSVWTRSLREFTDGRFERLGA